MKINKYTKERERGVTQTLIQYFFYSLDLDNFYFLCVYEVYVNI